MNRSSLVIGVTALALAFATAGVLTHPTGGMRPSPRLPLAGQILPAEDVPDPVVAPTPDPGDDNDDTWTVLIEQAAPGSDDRGTQTRPGRSSHSEAEDSEHDSDEADEHESADEDEHEHQVTASSTGSGDTSQTSHASDD